MTATANAPEVITRYLDLATSSDFDALTECFAKDAIVLDDGGMMRGRDEIRRWREDLAGKVEYTATVRSAESTGTDAYLVTVTIDGNFPGSPVDLRYQFTLQNDLISILEIAP